MCLPRGKFVAAYAILSRWPVETKGCVSRSGSESVRLGLREARGQQRGEAEVLRGILVQAWLQDCSAKCRERPSHSSGWLLRELP